MNTVCVECGNPSNERMYCSTACRQKAYRDRARKKDEGKQYVPPGYLVVSKRDIQWLMENMPSWLRDNGAMPADIAWDTANEARKRYRELGELVR